MLDKYLDIKTGEDLKREGIIPKSSSAHLALISYKRLEAIKTKLLGIITDEMLGSWNPLLITKKITEPKYISDRYEISRKAKPGMKVRGIGSFEDNDLSGLEGVIATVSDSDGRLGIKFNKKIPKGHNLNGLCDEGYGWWTAPGALELELSGTEIEIKDIASGVVCDEELGHKVKFSDDFKGYGVKDGNNTEVKLSKGTTGTLIQYKPKKQTIILRLNEGNNTEKSKKRDLEVSVKDLYGKLEVSSLGQIEPVSKEDAVKKQTLLEFFPKTVIEPSTGEDVITGLLIERDMIFYGDPGTGKTMLIEDIITIAKHQGVIFKVEDCQVQCNPSSLFDEDFFNVVKACPECMIKYHPDFKKTGYFVKPDPKKVKVTVARYGDGMGIEFVQGTGELKRIHLAGFKVPKLDGTTTENRESEFDPEGYHAGSLNRTNNGILHLSEMSRLRKTTLENFLDMLEDKRIKPDQLRWNYPANSIVLGSSNDPTPFDAAINDRMLLIPIRYPVDPDISYAITRKAYHKEFGTKNQVQITDTNYEQPLELKNVPMAVTIERSIDMLFIKLREGYSGAGKNRISGSNRAKIDALGASRARLMIDQIFYEKTPETVSAEYAIAGIQFALCARIQEETNENDIAARKEIRDWVASEFPKILEEEESTWWCNVYKDIATDKTQVKELGDNFITELVSYNKIKEGDNTSIKEAYNRIKEAYDNPKSERMQKAKIKYPFMNYLFKEQPKFKIFNEKQLFEFMDYLMKCRERSKCELPLPK
ncbi:hypothetical protein HYX19_01475 [Candidatus Woesearchaeota archaeon]|nr:hypothetical protein [Candidatus Woesearchaeota archaeon]